MADKTHQGFIPALDGLRGVAILLVLFHHLTIYRPTSGIDQWIASVPLIGWCGVNLFFVLSGFLITSILIDSRGSDHYFTSFYARRTLRIFPLYYLFVFLTLEILPLLPGVHEALVGPYPIPSKWPYWLYLTNFSVADRGFVHGLLDIAWSLAIEEQFYLVWAVVVYYCAPQRLWMVCVAIMVIQPLGRNIALELGTDSTDIYVLTWFRLDALATGSLLAWMVRRDFVPMLLRWAPTAVITGLTAVATITVVAGDSWWWNAEMQRVGFSVIAITAGAMVILTINSQPRAWVPRLLSMGWLRAFGKYSYCLYLVHLPVMRAVREYVFNPDEVVLLAASPWIGQILFYGAATAPAFAVAWVSWRVIEAPILALKSKFPY